MKKSLILFSMILLASLVALAADVTGTWSIRSGASGAPQKLTLATVNGKVLNGRLDGQQILSGGYKNSEFWFSVYREGKSYQYKGSFDGNTMVLHESAPNNKNNTFNYNRAGS